MLSQTDSNLSCEFEVEIKDNITIVKIPETYVDKPLTKLQNEMLLLFEEEFACRYTDDDEEYVATVKLGSSTPPLVPSYRPRWSHRKDDRSSGLKRPWESRRSYNDSRHSHYSHNNRPYYDSNNYYKR